MSNPMILKLEHGVALTDEDRAKLADISISTHMVGARTDLIGSGDNPRYVNLVLDGFACRYKMLADGSRSIVGYLLPGDFCDLHVAILGTMDHSIATISPCTIVRVSRDTILNLTENFARITRAMWWATLVDESILRQWLVNMGCLTSEKRLAHLLCELFWRLRMVGHATENTIRLPLTQQEMGETLGITGVHVNRVMQQLRDSGVINGQNRHLTIPDPARLESYAEFDPTYLHLSGSLDNR